jgi:hypothetical protein
MVFRTCLYSLGDAVPKIDAEPAQSTLLGYDKRRHHARDEPQFLRLTLRQRGRRQDRHQSKPAYCHHHRTTFMVACADKYQACKK